MRRIILTALLGLLASSCGGGVDSYEDAMEAQMSVMNEMMDVLEDVNDEASAKAATPKIAALGDRLAKIAEQVEELPKPSDEELQRIGQEAAKKGEEFQQRSMQQLMKLGEYPELGAAFSDAVSKQGR